MVEYAYPARRELPRRKRCKVRHSARYPARCRHPRDHEGNHWFGVWHAPGAHIALDTPLPELATQLSTDTTKGTP